MKFCFLQYLNLIKSSLLIYNSINRAWFDKYVSDSIFCKYMKLIITQIMSVRSHGKEEIYVACRYHPKDKNHIERKT